MGHGVRPAPGSQMRCHLRYVLGRDLTAALVNRLEPLPGQGQSDFMACRTCRGDAPWKSKDSADKTGYGRQDVHPYDKSGGTMSIPETRLTSPLRRGFASHGVRHRDEQRRSYRWLLNRRFVGLLVLSVIASLIGITGTQSTASAVEPDHVTISFTFDDAWDTQYAALPVFARYGMHSTLYVNSGTVGDNDIMTWSQLHDFADAGHEIGGHTANHTGLTEVNEATARAEIQADITALQAHGFPRPVSFAYPYGYWGQDEADGSGRRAIPTHAPPMSTPGSRTRRRTLSRCG